MIAGGALPVVPGGRAEHEALHALLTAAQAQGLPARLLGHPGGQRAGRAECLHAGAGVLGATLLMVTPWAATWLGMWLVSAALRLLGYPGLGAWWPRQPSWTLLLRRPSPDTRLVYYVALDRARPIHALRIATFALLAASVAASLGPAALLAGLAAAQGGLLVLALAWGWIRPDPAPPEARVVEAFFAAAPALDDGVAMLVCGSAATDGAGVRAALDWYGAPARCRVVWVTGVAGADGEPVASGAWRGGLGGRSDGDRGLLQAPGLEALCMAGHDVERCGGVPGSGAAKRTETLVDELKQRAVSSAAPSPERTAAGVVEHRGVAS